MGTFGMRIAAFLALAVLAVNSVGAQSYPSKHITVITPYGAGATSDIVARVYAEKLSTALGQAVVVENQSGAGGTLGVAAAARAKPDGYTLLVATASTHTANQHMYKNLAYDPEKDFAPISLVLIIPGIISANKDFPVANLDELVKYANENPNKVNYGSDGIGTITHIVVEALKIKTGASLNHIPYRGGVQALTALRAGDIQVASTGPIAIPLAVSGQTKALAVMNSKRLAVLPNVQTVTEAGYGDVIDSAPSWMAFFAPAGTNPEIVKRLGSELKRISEMPDVRTKLEGIGETTSSTPEELAARITRESQKWGNLIRRLGITPE